MSVGFEMRSLRRKCHYRGDYTKMKEMLREIHWGAKITGSTTSEKFIRFSEIMLGAEEECIPYGEGGNRQRKPPWFIGEAKRSVRRKFFAYMRYRETGFICSLQSICERKRQKQESAEEGKKSI